MKKKIIFLLTLTMILSLFSIKMVDDSRSKAAFKRAFEESLVIEKQEVKILFSSLAREEKVLLDNEESLENISDIENLDFYSVNNEEKIADNKIQHKNKKENSNEFQKNESLIKEISEYTIPNKAKETLEGIEKMNTFKLSLKEPVKLSRVISNKIESTQWASVKIQFNDYSREELIDAQSESLIAVKSPLRLRLPTQKNLRAEISKAKDSGVDRISTKLASTERSKDKDLAIQAVRKTDIYLNESDVKDDLVFFDYSDSESISESSIDIKDENQIKTTTTNTSEGATKKKISSYKNDKGQSNNQSNKKINQQQWKASNSKVIVADAQKNQENSILDFDMSKSLAQDSENFLSKSEKKATSDYVIQVYDAETNEDSRNFDVRFSDDEDEIVTDNGTGEVYITKSLQNNNGIRRATILSRGNYPTTLDIVLEMGETIASVPVFTREYLGKILTSQNLRGNGAYLLVELDKKTEDINIDGKFEAKLYLSKNLRIVEPGESDYSYIMLVGVEAGNTILKFRTVTGKVISKIVHLESEEIYYDPNFYFDIKKDEFDLIEEHLLSKSFSPLALDAKKIEGLTFDAKFKKLTLNKYQISTTTYPVGTRSYIQLNHLDEPLFVGRWHNGTVKIPSESYMRYVLDQFRIGSVSSQCLVQINLNKSAKQLYYNGLSSGRGMRVQAKILDKDGIFYGDLSSESEKIFLLGEEQGIINVQVQYVDGTIDYLQSYCSDSTYLVEQL